jgi:signal peptidase II
LRKRKLEALILPITVALILLADQISKSLVARWLGEGQSWDAAPWLAPIFSITRVTNTGAAFGMFPGLNSLFIVVNVIVIVAILIYHYRYLPDGQALVRIALSLQLGGAVGNLVDRVRQGFVLDFLDLNFWPLRSWPIFNVADSCIVTGVVVLTLLMLWEERREQDSQRVAADG